MQFLFERLFDPTRARHKDGSGFDLREAVRDQIQRLVWARTSGAGDEASNAIDFGLPSIVEIGQNNSSQLERYAQRLKRLIEHYEPRLGNVRIELEQMTNPLNPYRLRVEGVLAIDGEQLALQFPVELADR